MIGVARFLRNIASRDWNRRLAALNVLATRLVPGYRLTWWQMDWWGDEDFNLYLDRFSERRAFNTHRKWTLWQLLRLVDGIDGDTAECGVFEGASSWLICAAIQGTERTHYLFDSFEGLSQPEAVDGSHWKVGALAAGEDLVLDNLRPFAESLAFHKGWIPDRFPDVAANSFAFVHVDVDLHQPTWDAVEFFYPRLSPGGILLCDDYGCSTCPGATAAVDAFLADKPEKMISLDAGGGFFIKGVWTDSQRKPLEMPEPSRGRCDF